MALSSKRARAASDTKPSSKKFKSAKDVSAEASIAVDVPEQKSTDDKEPFWELSSKRRVTIQEFKGTTLVAIREFYEKDGKSLPGKSGISLTAEQFAVLIKATPAIRSALAAKGINIRDEPEEKDTVSEEENDDVEADGGKMEEVKQTIKDNED